MSVQRSATNKQEAGRICDYIIGLPLPFTVTIKEGKKRTLSQNQLIHLWFGEIAKQTHESTDQIKRECKYYHGCPILMAEDPQFVKFVENLSHLTVEEKIAAMDYVAVTSVMDTKQLGRFADAVQRKYLGQGLRLTDPEMQKYEKEVQS